MKAPISHRPSGFTLVELLVVIVIIAALATLGTVGGLKALETAKRSASMAVARGIESAANNFFTEYGSMPSDGSETVDTTCTTKKGDIKGIALLEVLLGTDTDINTRGIKFLQVTEGKITNKQEKTGVNGIFYKDTGEVNALYDPWGGVYHVILDFDLDEKVSAKAAADTTTKTLNGRRVAVWSDGADGVNGGGKKADDVKTWIADP